MLLYFLAVVMSIFPLSSFHSSVLFTPTHDLLPCHTWTQAAPPLLCWCVQCWEHIFNTLYGHCPCVHTVWEAVVWSDVLCACALVCRYIHTCSVYVAVLTRGVSVQSISKLLIYSVMQEALKLSTLSRSSTSLLIGMCSPTHHLDRQLYCESLHVSILTCPSVHTVS